jgi:hypothetical protein
MVYIFMALCSLHTSVNRYVAQIESYLCYPLLCFHSHCYLVELQPTGTTTTAGVQDTASSPGQCDNAASQEDIPLIPMPTEVTPQTCRAIV